MKKIVVTLTALLGFLLTACGATPEKTSSRYYVLPGGNGYLGLTVHSSKLSLANKPVDQTCGYLSGGAVLFLLGAVLLIRHWRKVSARYRRTRAAREVQSPGQSQVSRAGYDPEIR